MEIKEQIRQFIVKNFYVADPGSLADDTSLLDQAIIDSTGVLEVTGWLESTFGIEVADAELLPENLDSIARMSDYVERKKLYMGT